MFLGARGRGVSLAEKQRLFRSKTLLSTLTFNNPEKQPFPRASLRVLSILSSPVVLEISRITPSRSPAARQPGLQPEESFSRARNFQMHYLMLLLFLLGE